MILKEINENCAYIKKKLNIRRFNNKDKVKMHLELIDHIKNDEIYLVYQPKIRNSTGELIGLEALVRFNGREDINIENYIKKLENMNLIHIIDFYVIKKVVMQICKWREEGRKKITISMNMCFSTLLRKGFKDKIEDIINENEINEELEIEITERNIPFEKIKDISKVIDFLKDINVKTAIDDFGKGSSNIGFLLASNIDTLKIDKSLIKGLKSSNRTRGVVECLINMCKVLKVDAIVEGVEENEELEILMELGCEISQGYYFSKPIVAKKIIEKYNI